MTSLLHKIKQFVGITAEPRPSDPFCCLITTDQPTALDGLKEELDKGHDAWIDQHEDGSFHVMVKP